MQNNNILEKDKEMSEKKSRVPKPFSIESLIASNPAKQSVPSGGTINTKTPPSMAFPGDISLMDGTANTIYNPWIHNYFMQQRRLTEQLVDTSNNVATNLVHLREKTSEMLFDHLNTPEAIQQSEHRRQLIEQYLAGGLRDPKLSGFLMNGSDFYKSYGHYGHFLTHHYREDEPIESVDDRHKLFSSNDGSGQQIANVDSCDSRPEDSGTDDINEMDSDCCSESSVNTSPDGEPQGNCDLSTKNMMNIGADQPGQPKQSIEIVFSLNFHRSNRQ